MERFDGPVSTSTFDRLDRSVLLFESSSIVSFSSIFLVAAPPFRCVFQHFFPSRPVTVIRAAAPRPRPLLRRPRRRGYAAGSVADCAGPSNEQGNPLCFSWLTDDIERLDMDASCVARFTVPSQPFSWDNASPKDRVGFIGERRWFEQRSSYTCSGLNRETLDAIRWTSCRRHVARLHFHSVTHAARTRTRRGTAPCDSSTSSESEIGKENGSCAKSCRNFVSSLIRIGRIRNAALEIQTTFSTRIIQLTTWTKCAKSWIYMLRIPYLCAQE